MSFTRGFVKIAITQKFLNRAATKAKNSKNFVRKISEIEGSFFPGPLAGKYSSQERLFRMSARLANSSKGRATRKARRMMFEKRPRSGRFFRQMLGRHIDSIPIGPSVITKILSENKSKAEQMRALARHVHEKMVKPTVPKSQATEFLAKMTPHAARKGGKQ